MKTQIESIPNGAPDLGTLIEPMADAEKLVLTLDEEMGDSGVAHLCIEGQKTHLLITLPEGQQAFVQLELPRDAEHHTLEVILADNAALSLQLLQPVSADRVEIRQRAKVGANAKLHMLNITLGESVEQDFVSEISGAHGESSVDWVFYGNEKNKQQLSAENVFLAEEGSGEIIMKGIAEQNAHATCNGMITIGPNGSGTNAYLTEEVLMLDKTAKIDAVPGLEIKTNDVKASHSATVSRITPEDLFYLGSRGIPEATARNMYIEGFVSSMLPAAGTANSAEHVLDMINKKQEATC